MKYIYSQYWQYCGDSSFFTLNNYIVLEPIYDILKSKVLNCYLIYSNLIPWVRVIWRQRLWGLNRKDYEFEKYVNTQWVSLAFLIDLQLDVRKIQFFELIYHAHAYLIRTALKMLITVYTCFWIYNREQIAFKNVLCF